MGKLYERIINARVKKQVTITKAQAGGKPGCSTVDHLIVLKQTILEIRAKGQTAYIIFLDVQKAYDKVWLDAIIYALHQNGVKGKNLRMINKANLRDLIAATGLVILHKLDLNHRFFIPCDLEIWWMTKKNNRAPLLCYFKLFASFHSHWWIQTGVTVRKLLIWVNIDAFFSLVTLKFDGWPSKTIGHLFYATSSFMYHFVAIGEFKLELESGNAQSGSNSTLFRAVWPWNLTDDLQKQ